MDCIRSSITEEGERDGAVMMLSFEGLDRRWS